MSELNEARADFESWATTEAGWSKASTRMRLGRYSNPELHLLWLGFAAAWNRRTAPQASELTTTDAGKLRRLRDGMDRWGWCAEFGALAMEVLRDVPPTPAAQQQAATVPGWQRITAPGQVKVGMKLRLTIGDEKYSETAKLILHPGTDKEEIIYNKRQNYYLITSMAIANRGSQKNCEFLGAAATTDGRDGS